MILLHDILMKLYTLIPSQEKRNITYRGQCIIRKCIGIVELQSTHNQTDLYPNLLCNQIVKQKMTSIIILCFKSEKNSEICQSSYALRVRKIHKFVNLINRFLKENIKCKQKVCIKCCYRDLFGKLIEDNIILSSILHSFIS